MKLEPGYVVDPDGSVDLLEISVISKVEKPIPPDDRVIGEGEQPPELEGKDKEV